MAEPLELVVRRSGSGRRSAAPSPATLIEGSSPTYAFPCDRYLVRLGLTAPANFRHELHGGAVRGLLSAALGSRLPEGIIPFAPESGRRRLEPGDRYNLAVTLVGEQRRLAAKIENGLRRIGATPADRSRPLPRLGGNFAVVAMQQAPARDRATQYRNLRGKHETELRLLSPLVLAARRADGSSSRNFGPDYFPFGIFLDRLWRRQFRLLSGRWPTSEEIQLAQPRPSGPFRVDRTGLRWKTLPADGNRPGRNFNLRGAVGSILIRGDLGDWLPILLAGQDVHAGKSTSYGMGRYCLGAGGYRPEMVFPQASSRFKKGDSQEPRLQQRKLRQARQARYSIVLDDAHGANRAAAEALLDCFGTKVGTRYDCWLRPHEWQLIQRALDRLLGKCASFSVPA